MWFAAAHVICKKYYTLLLYSHIKILPLHTYVHNFDGFLSNFSQEFY